MIFNEVTGRWEVWWGSELVAWCIPEVSEYELHYWYRDVLERILDRVVARDKRLR